MDDTRWAQKAILSRGPQLSIYTNERTPGKPIFLPAMYGGEITPVTHLWGHLSVVITPVIHLYAGGGPTRLPIDKGCNCLDTRPRRCIISVSLLFFLFLSEKALCCLQFMDDTSTWKTLLLHFCILIFTIYRGYRAIPSTPYHRPVSLLRFGGPKRFTPEAKTAANVDMAFLTAAQNLVEMRRHWSRQAEEDGWTVHFAWGNFMGWIME